MMLVVDGNNMVHRALHTMSLSNSRGEDVSVLYGTLKMLVSLLNKMNPYSLVVCFDGGTPPYRKQLWPSYKAHRVQAEDDNIDWESVYQQLATLRDYALPLHGAKVVYRRHVEADDLMAHIAKLSLEPVTIVTSDDDLLQCVSDTVSVYNPFRDVTYTPSNFEKLLGVPSYTWLLYKALVGDSSDGISGVPGIGPKTAVKLIRMVEEVGDQDPSDLAVLSSIADNTPGVTTKQKETLRWLNESYWRNMLAVMDLSVDRVGAISAIANSKPWSRPSIIPIKAWLMRHEFVSLLNAKYYNPWMMLGPPSFNWDGVKAPIPMIDRIPTGGEYK